MSIPQPLKVMLVKALTEQALNYGAKRMSDPTSKTNEKDVFTNISNIVGGFVQNERKPQKSKADVDQALTRLSDVIASLEEKDSHQMIADIMTLVRESERQNDEVKMKWVTALYGGPTP